ncbi:TPA: methyltransferase domain-containing protein [Candidatus Woesearchaeota archaeon]|nr:methyltransferase domain-containing protein [Candidatus Woesearchaeota archaeon]
MPAQNPTDKIVKKNLETFNRWAPQYDFSLFQWWMKKFHRKVFAEVDKNVEAKQKAKFLDLSCGTGELLYELAKTKPRLQLFGVDIAENMLALAKHKVPSAKFFQMDVHHLKLKDNTFDYVVSTEAFHHYPNQHKAVSEMVRVCKPGGKVMIADINFFSSLLHHLFVKVEPGCVYINSRKEMIRLFEEAGLKNIRQERTFLFAVTTIGMKRKEKKK